MTNKIEIKICFQCKKEFAAYKCTKRKFCSKICSYTSRRTGKAYPHCIDCHKKLGDYKSTRCKSCFAKIRKWGDMTKQKIGDANRGKRNGMFEKSPLYKKFKYRNIWMRSSWEVKYAIWLDKNQIKWLYEPKSFKFDKTSYRPDFYLPETNEYIEIKGYFRDKDKKRIVRFIKLYPLIKLTVLLEKELKLERII